jgi:predicted dinucleotide-binding enzyme
MTDPTPVISILGAGRLGKTLARLAAAAGYQVVVAGAADAERAAEQGDIVILAIPLGKYRTIPADALAGKLVIDATNYWWEVDGFADEFTDPIRTSSELLQTHLPASRLVKAFNHMGYRDLEDEARPSGAPGRKAIGIAGDNGDDLEVVAGIVDDLGFDPVMVGTLADGVTLEPGTEPFGADVDADELRALVARFADSQRGRRRAAALAARASGGREQ